MSSGSRWWWRAVLVLVAGVWTMYLGALAFAFPWIMLNPVPFQNGVHAVLQQAAQALREPPQPITWASLSAGLVLAPCMVYWLERCSQRRRAVFLSMAIGVLYQFGTVWLAMIVVVPMLLLSQGGQVTPLSMVTSAIVGMLAAAFGGPILSIMYLPFILVGAS